jgi:hypothetical protein
MIIYGTYKFFPRRVACKNAWCTSCGDETLAVGTRRILFLHLLFIPLFPIGTATQWVCEHCHRDVDASRPVGSAVAGCGILAGAFFLFIAASGMLIAVLDKKSKSRWDDHLLFLVIGLVMVGGFFWVRRRAQRGYEASAKLVDPLDGEACPLCGQPVLLIERPRCTACDVEIVIK